MRAKTRIRNKRKSTEQTKNPDDSVCFVLFRLFRILTFVLCLGLPLVLQGCRQTERSIKTGETAVFDIHLKKGQFQAIRLEQKDGDLAMTLVPPNGEAHRADYFDGTNVEEKLFWRAEEEGPYKLTVTPVSKKKDFSLRYKLTIEPPREPIPQDLDRLEAQRLYEQASRLADNPQPGGLEGEGRHDLFAKLYEESAAKWRSAGETALTIITLLQLGWKIYGDDLERAKSYCQQALHEAQLTMNIRGQAEAYSSLGIIYDDMSRTWEDKQEAKRFRDEALELSLQAGDRRAEASALSNLGAHYFSIGEYQLALEHLLRALARMRELGNQEQEALVLANLGAAYRSLGLKAEAERAYNEALEVARTLGDRLQQARAHDGLGRVINSLGDGTLARKLEAMENFEEAVKLGGKSRIQQLFELNLGTVSYELGDMYNRLGEPEKARENFNQALSHLQEALRLQREQGGSRVHHTLASLGLLNHSLGKAREADRLLQEALEISRKANDRYQEATVLAALARIARDRGNLVEARTRIEGAIKLIELLGLRIRVPEWRSAYATSQQHFYDLQADILLRLYALQPRTQPSGGYHKVAWQQVEKARRITLQDLLDTLGVSFSNGIDPKLIKERIEVRARISQAKPPKYTEDQVDALVTRYQEIERQIRQQNPRYDRLLYSPIDAESLNELQQRVLKEDTILLEYALSQDRTYLWAITPTTFEVFTLPPRIQLERAALQVHEAITGVKLEEATDDRQPEPIEQRLFRLKGSERQYRDAAARLSDMLLGPVASRLEKRKLLIVGDGLLGRIPFGALPVPAQHPGSGTRLLLQDHEIAYAPSAMTLLSLHREQGAAKTEVGSVIAIADPVFNSRHRQASYCKDRRPDSGRSSPVSASLSDAVVDELFPVPFDDAEKAKFRGAVFGQSPTSSRKELFQFQAKRSNVIDDRLAQYTDIIFYTHGIFNEGEQGMTGLALSRLNEQCGSEDYLLNLNDIYNLRLSADLVTLIACNTSRDRTMRGFGIGSIAHGFMFAGAAHVLGTLWDVDGPASLDLITKFYRNRREGQPAPEALRAAQLSFLADGNADWRLPYYWAGFVLMGETN